MILSTKVFSVQLEFIISIVKISPLFLALVKENGDFEDKSPQKTSDGSRKSKPK